MAPQVDYSCLKYSYSIIAAAAVFCTSLALNEAPVFPQVLHALSADTVASLVLANLAACCPTALLVCHCKRFAMGTGRAAAVQCASHHSWGASQSRSLCLTASACTQGRQKHSGFSEEALRPVALALAALARKAPQSSLVSVYKKYNQAKFQEVAKIQNLEELLQERMVA